MSTPNSASTCVGCRESYDPDLGKYVVSVKLNADGTIQTDPPCLICKFPADIQWQFDSTIGTLDFDVQFPNATGVMVRGGKEQSTLTYRNTCPKPGGCYNYHINIGPHHAFDPSVDNQPTGSEGP